MQDDIFNKFTKNDDLKAKFDEEEERLNLVKRFLNVYKNNLS